MFHNYFFLKRLASDLDGKLKDYILAECFSQNKDELILAFTNATEEFYIRANLDPSICLLDFPIEFSRAKKNSVDLFPRLLDQQVVAVLHSRYDRSFRISFANTLTLLFKMHGSRSNILLCRNNEVLSVFRNSLPQDLQISPQELSKDLTLNFERFSSVEGDPQQFLPALGKEVKNYLWNSGYHNLPLPQRWQLMQQTLRQMEENPIRIVETSDGPALSLLTTEGSALLETHDALEAARKLYEAFTKGYYLNKEKQSILRRLENQITKTRNYIQKTKEKLSQVQSQKSYQHLADIIMANLHALHEGRDRAMLFDFYANEQIEIKLNPKVSPQRYAENLYRKARNQRLEVQRLTDNIQTRENALQQLLLDKQQAEEASEIKEIRTFSKQVEKKESAPGSSLPYQETDFGGFRILIGRNARANDELTLRYATKNDLWLHARDVPGSHVVVKYQAGKKVPSPVVERAAELAAWFSKRKNETLCPVIHTEKKYVRKRKGAPPGQVIVEKESVIMVTPRGLDL